MEKRLGNQTWYFENVYVNAVGTAVGPKEGSGPLGTYFDESFETLYCGEKNWEMAERCLMERAVNHCLEKQGKTYQDIEMFIAGDLMNQIVTSSYFARELHAPFLGIFGACSTSMEGLAIASSLVDGGFVKEVISATSSHNCTAEKQFRYPTEYGGQKPETFTYTVTGAGAICITRKKSDIRITHATIGKVVDLGISDPFNMGTAMAPAAADTIVSHFKDTNRTSKDFDLIVTGDLSRIGAPICKKMVEEEGYDLGDVYNDCGLMIYKKSDAEVFAGGSGCGCSATVTYGYIMEQLRIGKLKRVLVVATGALLNPIMIQQKETIPGIAHGVVFESLVKE